MLSTANSRHAITVIRIGSLPPPHREIISQTAARLLLRETPVGCLDEHIRGPGTGSSAVLWIVVPAGPGGFHLFQRHTLLDHGLDAVADDGDHVAILEHVEFVTNAAMTGNYI